ncbi:MAG: amidohydrolase family protein [Potamolinea sp.]
MITQALEIAAKYKMPVQFHTGFGDPDLDLRLGNPVYLRPLLEEKRFRNAPIVLLHASYPYTQEAGYLASVYPQVYLDFGLAVPFLSVAGMRSTVQQLLELAPTSKLMYSSDAHNIPELYYLGKAFVNRKGSKNQSLSPSDKIYLLPSPKRRGLGRGGERFGERSDCISSNREGL